MDYLDNGTRALLLLRKLGFTEVTSEYNDCDIHEVFDWHAYKEFNIVLSENNDGGGRNNICVILQNDGGYYVFVRANVGFGYCYIPFLWTEIEFDWLNDFKKALTGSGFNEQGRKILIRRGYSL